MSEGDKRLQESRLRSFETKKQTKKWLDENLESSSNEVVEVNKPGLGGKIKHCLKRCKFNREDESKGDMIECSLCKNWFHLNCVKIGQEGEKQEGQSKDTKSRDTKSAQERGQYEDEAGTNVENPITFVEDTVLIDDEAEKNDDGHDVGTVDNVDGEGDDADGDGGEENEEIEGLWFCELCSLIPSQVSDLVSKFTGFQKEIKAMISLLEDMKKSQNSENSKETHGNANPPVKNNATAPVEKESKTIEFDTSRCIVEENIHLKRQNKELKERLDFTERLLDQIDRDQDEKRKLEKTVEATANWTMERKPSKKKNVSVQSNIISTKNRFDFLESEAEESDEGDESQTEFWPNPYEKSRPWKKPIIRFKRKENHTNADSKRGNHNHSHESKVKDSPNRGKTVIIGDPQLHRIEEKELSNRYVKTLVRSKGGLKIEDVDNKYQSILEEDVQEVIFHVGVNNVQNDNEQTILRKYQEMGESVQIE